MVGNANAAKEFHILYVRTINFMLSLILSSSPTVFFFLGRVCQVFFFPRRVEWLTKKLSFSSPLASDSHSFEQFPRPWQILAHSSPVKLSTHLALTSSCSTLCHSWSVMCGIPLSTSPCSWLPWRDRKRCSASSVRLSDESTSRPTRFLHGNGERTY